MSKCISPVMPLGETGVTPGALAACNEAGVDVLALLLRHAHGDWGVLDAGDTQANKSALKHGDRVLSVYPINAELTVWVITEADRASTTILLPEEY